MHELAIKYQNLQIPIFQRLISTNIFLKGYKIVFYDQYISMEKKYDDFWINIEIEDAESFEDIQCYVVRFKRHEDSWVPSTEEEEMDDYPIRKEVFHDIDSLREFIERIL